jgi:hypothetical protein
MKAHISMCLCSVNIVSKLFRPQFSNRCYRWIGPLNNMATLSSSGKEIFPQTVRSIESYFKQKEIQFQHGHTTIIAKCPFCATTSSRESRTSAIENQGSFSLFVNKTTGSHVCNSCGTSGTWNQLKVCYQGLALVSICEIDVTSFSEDGRGVKWLCN